jgi:aspartate racemase
MRVIGLIGGMSWNSSAEYYRIINELVTEKLGGLHSARLVLYNLDFDLIEKAQCEARWDDASNTLTEAAMAVKAAGADFLVICTNTMHKVAEAVAERANLPLLHIGDVVGNALRERGVRKAGLLGTRFVMEEAFYRNRLEEIYGIEVVVPEEEERTIIDRIIYDELCREIIKPASRRACHKVISGLVEQGAEGIILGCTELPLLIRQKDLKIPVFDTTRLHAEAAVDRALFET